MDKNESPGRSREGSSVSTDSAELRRIKRDTRNELASLDRTEEFKLLESIQTTADIKERRKIQNRYSQRRLRDFKKSKIEELEGILSDERKVLQQLKEDNAMLKAQLMQMQDMMMRGFPMVQPGFMSPPINNMALNMSVNSMPLNSVPLNSVPLNSMPLNSMPLNSMPMNAAHYHQVMAAPIPQVNFTQAPRLKHDFQLNIPPLPIATKREEDATPTTTESSQVVQALLGMRRVGFVALSPVMQTKRSATPAL